MNVWTFEDAVAGRCQIEDIDELCPIEIPPDPVPFEPLTRDRRRQLLTELSDKLLIQAHADPQGFVSNAGPQINKFLDLASKLDAEESQVPHLVRLSAAKMRTMPTRELFMSFASAVMDEDTETRERLMARMGCSLPDLVDELICPQD